MISLLMLGSQMGCTTLDPKTSAATQYINSVQPLMIENSLLSERLLLLAAQIYNEDVPDDGFSPSYNDEIVPLAEHLHIQAESTEVPSEWQDLHENLVVIWSDRASAYRSMGEAIILADRTRWDEARRLQDQVVKREETWFQTVGSQLGQYDLTLEQYP